MVAPARRTSFWIVHCLSAVASYADRVFEGTRRCATCRLFTRLSRSAAFFWLPGRRRSSRRGGLWNSALSSFFWNLRACLCRWTFFPSFSPKWLQLHWAGNFGALCQTSSFERFGLEFASAPSLACWRRHDHADAHLIGPGSRLHARGRCPWAATAWLVSRTATAHGGQARTFAFWWRVGFTAGCSFGSSGLRLGFCRASTSFLAFTH